MIEYSIVPEENVLYCHIAGPVTLLDFLNYINKLTSDSQFKHNLNSIIYISETTTVSYAKEAAGIGQVFTRFLQLRKGIAWAFVISSQITMSLTRFVMEEIDTSPIDVGYFNTETEAKKWIDELSKTKEVLAV